MLKEIVHEETVELPDFLSTRLEYDKRDALFYELLHLMVKRGRAALIPKLMDKMQRASGNKIKRFNRFQARLIKFYGGSNADQ